MKGFLLTEFDGRVYKTFLYPDNTDSFTAEEKPVRNFEWKMQGQLFKKPDLGLFTIQTLIWLLFAVSLSFNLGLPIGIAVHRSAPCAVYRYLLRSNEQLLTALSSKLTFVRSYYHLLKTRYGSGFSAYCFSRK